MNIVFASLPAYGHLYPMMPLALACAEAGHEVTMATGEPFLGRLPIRTVRGVPAELDLGGAVAETRRRHSGIEGLDLTLALFADITAEFVSAALIPVLREIAPDLVVYEAMNVGAGVAADVLDVPAAAFSIGLVHAVVGRIHAAAVEFHRDQWVRRELHPPAGTPLLAGALLDPAPPSLREPGGGPRITRLPIRPTPFSESMGEVPGWLSAARARPCVYVTLGTVSFGAVDVLRRAIDEIAPLDADLLVAVGPEGDPTALGEVPANVHVERFVAQAAVLPLVDVVVQHGGTGTVLGALATGLPQLILPQGADHFFNGGVLSGIGAARVLRNDEQLPGAIARSVSAMLTDSPERTAARRLADEIAALPAPVDVLPDLLALADQVPAGRA